VESVTGIDILKTFVNELHAVHKPSPENTRELKVYAKLWGIELLKLTKFDAHYDWH
jgi:hypothetical protein